VDAAWVSHLRRLAFLWDYSQPLRAGLVSAAPTALKKWGVKGVRRLAALSRPLPARPNEGSAKNPPKGKFVEGILYVAAARR